jgi:O-antigen/teichoic acid export membrane protein
LFARKFVIRVVSSIIFAASSFISLIFMTRYVGEAYGMMMWGMSLVALFNTVLEVGFHPANIKMISEGKDLNKCVSTYLAIRIALSVGIVCMVLFTALVMNYLNSGFPREFWIVSGVFVLYFAVDNVLMVLRGTFIGHMDAGKETLALTATYLVRAASLIAFSLIGASAVVLSMGYVIGTLFALIIAYILFRPLKVRLVRPAFFREYWVFVAPLVIPMALIAVIGYIDKVMIGAFYGEFEVGIYTAAYGVVFALLSLGMVMDGILLSYMSKLNAAGKSAEARNTLWSAQKYLAMLMLPATVFLLVFGNETAVALFKSDFAASGPILSVFAIGIYLTVLANMFSQVLLSMNRTGQYGRTATVYAVSTLFMFFVLIPDTFFEDIGGGLGAAWATSIGKLFFAVLLVIALKRVGSPNIYPRMYIHLVAAAVLGAVLYAIKIYAGPEGILPLVVIALLSVIIYSGVLAAVREFTRNDIGFIRETLNPKNLYDDLMSEMTRER